MRIRIFQQAFCSVALLWVAVLAQQTPAPTAVPTFIEDWDVIRVWLPSTIDNPVTLTDQIQFTVDGEAWPVIDVVGASRAARANDPTFVVLPGTLQSALGGNDWDPSDEVTRMWPVQDDVFELIIELPAGEYAYKVARGGSWDLNFGADFISGGPDITLVLDEPRIVRFLVDFNLRTITDSVNQPERVPVPARVPEPPDWQALDPRGFVSVDVILGEPLAPRHLPRPMTLQVGENPVRPVIAREVLSDPVLKFQGDDLGNRWSPQSTTFKVWSPVAEGVELVLFDSAIGPSSSTHSMRRGTAGVWYVTVPGDLHGTYYQYHLRSYGRDWRAADIYGYAASADSSRSMVVDLSRTNPENWPAPRPFEGQRKTDSVLYEIHVRDFTIDEFSGVRPEWRGKYLGLTEAGTTVPGSNPLFPTGIDYLVDLGITHLHIMPIHDINPANSQVYNWGYETTLFNVPEEQYALDRHDSIGRIRETKQMIQALQERGISVVLDVVYNHSMPSQGPDSAFWAKVPYYYFRTNDRGDVLNESGVGNALHDQRPMVRKFIRESLEFWTEEYRIDGFRHDLKGMFATETNRILADAVLAIYPDAVIYGEPWTGGGPLRFGKGDQRGLGVAIFNDRFRGAFRGALDAPEPGFALGGRVDPGALVRAIMGSIDDFTDAPTETVNYVSAHDNLTMWDRVALSHPDASRETQEAMIRLAFAAVLLSQGVPFLEGGVELGRTKGMDNNSYAAGDEVNRYDWQRALDHRELHAFVRDLIRFRRETPALRMTDAEQVRARTLIHQLPEGETNVLAYAFHDAELDEAILIILNGSAQGVDMELPSDAWGLREWRVVFDDRGKVTESRPVGSSIRIDGLSIQVLRG